MQNEAPLCFRNVVLLGIAKKLQIYTMTSKEQYDDDKILFTIVLKKEK